MSFVDEPRLLVGPPILHRLPDGLQTLGDVELPDDPRFLGVVSRPWSRTHGVIASGPLRAPAPIHNRHRLHTYAVQAEVDDQLATLGLEPAPGEDRRNA